MAAGEMNLSLCGCGFLGIYHLGAARALLKHGPKFMSQVQRTAGASAGSLIASVIVCGPEKIEECIKFTFDLARNIRAKPLGAMTPRYSLLDPLQRFLDDMLPLDSHVTANDKLFISLTHTKTFKHVIISQFESREELISCLIASSFIPVYAGTKPPVIKGNKYIDGGISDNLYIFPDGRTVTVSPFCGKQDICPVDKIGRGWFVTSGNQDFQVNRNNLVRGLHALFPPSERNMKKYLEQGQKDAIRFLKEEGLYENGGDHSSRKVNGSRFVHDQYFVQMFETTV